MKKETKGHSVAMFVIGIIIIALGCKMFFWVVSSFPKGYASSKWPATTGVILNSGLKKTTGRSGSAYSPQITYQYTVNDMQYMNDRVSFPQRRASKSWAQGFLEKYETGSESKVYYDPGDPSVSCLEPGANYFFLIIMGLISIFLLGMGSVICFYGFKPIKSC